MQRIQPINRLHGWKGFTVVELTVVIVLMGILIPVFSVILVNTYRDSFNAKDQIQLSQDNLQALRYIEESTRTAKVFSAVKPSQFSDNYGPHNSGTAGAQAWSYKGDSATSRVLMTENYSSTTNALNSGRQPVFENTPAFNCSTEMTYQPQLTYLTIFFVYNGTLYKRILTDKTTPLCAGNAQSQLHTCPSYIAPWHSSCEANDEALADNVTEFSLQFYQLSQDGISTPIDASFTSTNPDILQTVDYVNVTLTTSVRNGSVTNSMTQRITKVNQ